MASAPTPACCYSSCGCVFLLQVCEGAAGGGVVRIGVCARFCRRPSHRSHWYPAKIASTSGAERLLVSRMELERIHSRLKVAVKAHQVGRS